MTILKTSRKISRSPSDKVLRRSVNLTELQVREEIATIISVYPDYESVQFFNLPTLQQQLVDYVLCRIPNQMVELEGDRQLTKVFQCSAERALRIENLVFQGIQNILENNDALILRWQNCQNAKSFGLAFAT